MSPDGFPPFANPFVGPLDPDAETEMVTKAVFAQQHHILSNEVDAFLDGNPALQADFDDVMDWVARDALTDDCNMAVVETTFIHLSDLGLVNAAPVKVVPGVAIPHYSPYQIERALNHKE